MKKMRQEAKSLHKIGVLEPVHQMTGGRAYRMELCRALEKAYDVELLPVTGARGFLPSIRLRRMWQISRIKKSKDVWILDFFPVAGMAFSHVSGKKIALLQHLHTEGAERDALGRVVEALYRRNIRRCDRVVVVSRFWKEYLEERLGLNGVRVIRNGIDPAAFSFLDGEIETFKKKHGLDKDVVIYIGNCRRDKGVAEVYEALKDCGYSLVSSGEPDVLLACPNLILPHREYLLLLKSSSVAITMSRFREGWCRTAHEAMLCKTPVIGSGAGGMAELLEGGNQLLCKDIAELPGLVERALEEKEKMGEEGFAFASQFTIEKFDEAWLALIEEVLRDEG